MAFRKVKKEDSFAQWFIDEFGVDKFNTLILHEKNKANGVDIWSISKRSAAMLWFRCENKEYHVYSVSADKYYIGARCKYCGRTKYVHPLDSFGQYIIDTNGRDFLDKIWSVDNKQSAFKYTLGSEQKAYFNCCECGQPMGLSQIKNYVVSRKTCKSCGKRISSLHQKTINYLNELQYSLQTEYSCSLIPINPVTKYPLPYDIEVAELKLIVEVHGRQHYEISGETSRWLHGMTSAEYLAKRKKYDDFKKSFALANGFFYLEVPYWAEDEDEYKTLIDAKIDEIQHTTHQQRLTRKGAISDSYATV